ncbi:MAG TPA: ATP-binding cassette domain-containing protein [Roseiarcus sp.]|nr:ATP-binding cassette domain-containing protein [Roseiarcus sp.]
MSIALGLGLIPAERFVFPDLTVMENLLVGARSLAGDEKRERIESALDDYPILRERASQFAGAMSGGQQRMVSLAMALMTRPRLLLLDEPSLGLAPAITEQIMSRVRALVDEGVSVVLVEQNIPAALTVADRVYALRSGRILLEESAADLKARGRDNWWKLFRARQRDELGRLYGQARRDAGHDRNRRDDAGRRGGLHPLFPGRAELGREGSLPHFRRRRGEADLIARHCRLRPSGVQPKISVIS